MNLSPLQIMSRNMFVHLTGVSDPASVDLAFLNPNLASLVETPLEHAITGPYGNVIPSDSSTFDEGFAAAMEYVNELLNQANSLDDVRAALNNETEAEETKAETEEGFEDLLTDMLSKMLGGEVRVIRL